MIDLFSKKFVLSNLQKNEASNTEWHMIGRDDQTAATNHELITASRRDPTFATTVDS